MRNSYRFFLLVLLIGLLVACQEESTPVPTPIPIATETPTVPPPTDIPAPPTITPYPTRDRTSGTEEPIDNDVQPGDWMDQPFVDDEGITRTLEEFQGRIVIIQTISASCTLCMEQQQYLADTIQYWADQDQLSDTVFLMLNVEQRQSTSLLTTVLQDQLGDKWPTIESLMTGENAAEYIVGQATPRLITALEEAFDPAVSDPENVTLILIERDGLAHLINQGMNDDRTLIRTISFYMIPPATDG